MGRRFRLSQRKGYQTSKPKQQPPNEEEDQPSSEEELIEDASCSNTFQSMAVQTDISCFAEASVAVQTDVSCFAEASVTVQTDVSCFDEASVTIQTDISCFDEISSIAISSGLELLSVYIPIQIYLLL